MTTMDTHVPSAEDTLGPGFACLADWVTTTDHKKIGRLYLGAGALTALASLVIAALLAAERIDINRELLGAGSLTQHAHIHSFTMKKMLALTPMEQVASRHIYTFGNKALILLRMHVFLKYLPFRLWRLLDKLANKLIRKPSRILYILARG